MALSQQSLISASCDLVSSSRVAWTGSHGYWQGSKRTDGITQGLLRLTLRTNTMSITLPSLDQSKSQGQLKFKEWKNTLFLLIAYYLSVWTYLSSPFKLPRTLPSPCNLEGLGESLMRLLQIIPTITRKARWYPPTHKEWTGGLPVGPVVKTLPSNAEGAGSIPGQGTKIPDACRPKKQT